MQMYMLINGNNIVKNYCTIKIDDNIVKKI